MSIRSFCQRKRFLFSIESVAADLYFNGARSGISLAKKHTASSDVKCEVVESYSKPDSRERPPSRVADFVNSLQSNVEPYDYFIKSEVSGESKRQIDK